eukprot:CAMPEP_0171345436 /NCGR_PEP_ID=MMETSP0878-20121228/21569_1 /TAXON_ID=67004 /ORGANISM="Thalassiosira weissflogii, Strain CCMP1336" /LENGTH=856 /DNA_ID=CAMNT_0011848839 /DNA_START=45 /DNA_END=2615 /DNA_ORIENTATION=+
MDNIASLDSFDSKTRTPKRIRRLRRHQQHFFLPTALTILACNCQSTAGFQLQKSPLVVDKSHTLLASPRQHYLVEHDNHFEWRLQTASCDCGGGKDEDGGFYRGNCNYVLEDASLIFAGGFTLENAEISSFSSACNSRKKIKSASSARTSQFPWRGAPWSRLPGCWTFKSSASRVVSTALHMMSSNSNSDDADASKGKKGKKEGSKGNEKSKKLSPSASSHNPTEKQNFSRVSKGSVEKNGDIEESKSKRSRRRNNKTNSKFRQRRQRQPRVSAAETGEKGDDDSKKLNGSNSSQSTKKDDAAKTSKITNMEEKPSDSSVKTTSENISLKDFKKAGNKSNSGSNKTTAAKGESYKSNNTKANEKLKKRVIQLESLVSNQVGEIQKLRREIDELTKTVATFANVVNMLREAGLTIDEVELKEDGDVGGYPEAIGGATDSLRRKSSLPDEGGSKIQQRAISDDAEIFGKAPTSVIDAADAAGSSILSAILAGKHRMLVDVRDAELSRDPSLFVEFIELAILPVAAGLEGLDGEEYTRNRVKIVFPTVKELMTYRRSMALAAPEVVALSTLGFDPVEERDNLIVVVAPSPDDVAGVNAMKKLIARTDRKYVVPDQRITQPVVVINHHMVPMDLAGMGSFTVVYHLRLLSVQYMTGDTMPDYVAGEKFESWALDEDAPMEDHNVTKTTKESSAEEESQERENVDMREIESDSALEAAMTHAHEIGVHQGVTRAMVIRAYPKPWHVFVDTSPDTDADFEVAATFDVEPTQEDVNYAIVECLEGSEREDELVAQQMQAALEAGQLNRVSDMLGISPASIAESVGGSSSLDKKDTDTAEASDRNKGNDWDDFYYDDWFNEDSV